MSKPIIRIHNTETNEIVDREMTDDEFNNFKADLLQKEQEQIAKNQANQKRLDLFDRLGITEEEAKLLLS